MTQSVPVQASMLELHGRRALVRLGARVASVYLIGAAAGVAAGPAAEPGTGSAAIGGPWAGVPAALGVLGLGLVIALAINCTVALVPPPHTLGDPALGDHDVASLVMPAASVPVSTKCDRWTAWVWKHAPDSARPMLVSLALRGGAVLAGLGVLAQVVATGPVTSWAAVHTVVGWVIPAVGLGLALAAGPGWGAAGFAVLGVGFALMVPAEAVAAVPATLAAASASVVVAAVIHLTARRGFATMEATIRAAQSADVAHVHAEQRLAARRRLDRMMHDTVLSTLTLLAYGGVGVCADQVRRDCRRDLDALRSDRWATPEDTPAAIRDASGTIRANLPRQTAPLEKRLDAVRELAARRGIDLRVHVQGRTDDEPSGRAGLDLGALEAWSSALAECVVNISRHAGVTAADVVLGSTEDALVTLVLDEGAGFETATVGPERLGLAGSVRDRLVDVGGQARVWSRPGQGTVVELVLPWPR